LAIAVQVLLRRVDPEATAASKLTIIRLQILLIGGLLIAGFVFLNIILLHIGQKAVGCVGIGLVTASGVWILFTAILDEAGKFDRDQVGATPDRNKLASAAMGAVRECLRTATAANVAAFANAAPPNPNFELATAALAKAAALAMVVVNQIRTAEQGNGLAKNLITRANALLTAANEVEDAVAPAASVPLAEALAESAGLYFAQIEVPTQDPPGLRAALMRLISPDMAVRDRNLVWVWGLAGASVSIGVGIGILVRFRLT